MPGASLAGCSRLIVVDREGEIATEPRTIRPSSHTWQKFARVGAIAISSSVLTTREGRKDMATITLTPFLYGWAVVLVDKTGPSEVRSKIAEYIPGVTPGVLTNDDAHRRADRKKNTLLRKLACGVATGMSARRYLHVESCYTVASGKSL
jgi:hypothetical protein